jgi:putative transposase
LDDELLSVPRDWPKAFAMFRAQIVAPLVDPLSTPEEKRQWRRFVTSREHVFPDGKARRIAERTLRGWAAAYRQAGWAGLERRKAPRNGPRKINPEIIERAVQLKRQEPRRSVPHILRIIEAERGEPLDITAGALWRHLAKAGLGARGAAPPAGLRRWEANGPNQLWQGDVKHGPYLPDPIRPDRMRKTYLIAFLDDYSRCIMHAEWFWAEDVYALEIVFQKALLRKGKPCRVYVDRGMIYQSHVFRNACMELGVRHISSTAYRPNGKGKIEKFWQCVDNEFLLELEHSPVQDLAEMNRRFQAWLEEIYHQRKHAETDQTPTARFASVDIAPLERPERLAELFLWRVKRTVDKTGCVSFEGNVYQVEPGLERRKVELRYHPLHLQRLQVWTGDQRRQDAVPVDLKRKHAPAVNRRHIEDGEAPPALYLEALVQRHEERKRRIISPLRLAGSEEGGEDRV